MAFEALFKAADEDDDKLLNLPEWINFSKKNNQTKEAAGEPTVTRTDEQEKVLYEAYKSINPETNGASIEDVGAAFSYYASVVLEQMDPLYLTDVQKESLQPLVKQELEKM